MSATKMKIAQIVSTFPPYHGGMGNVAYQYARGLAERGHEVTVFTPDFGRRAWAGEKFEVRLLRPAIQYSNAAWVPGLHKNLADFDVVHFHYPFLGGEFVLASKSPLVVSAISSMPGISVRTMI